MGRIHALSHFAKNNITNMRYYADYLIRLPSPRLSSSSPALLDTSIGSSNAGDAIIMHYAEKQIKSIWDETVLPRIPTHEDAFYSYPSITNKRLLKILCGTNALNLNMNRHHSIALPSNPELYRNSVLLMAVGLSNIKSISHSHFNTATKMILRDILSKDYIHSVRDSRTLQELNNIGIDNVLNTACVTMWDLTESFCAEIPSFKHTDVLTTITDYGFDPKLDGYMLRTLGEKYRNVYLWVQGSEDLNRLATLGGLPHIRTIRGGFIGLQKFIVEHKDIDYFGTRLHCGIYCLNHKIRSTIVSIDNRAADIANDTNLPIVERRQLPQCMKTLIDSNQPSKITIPTEAISKWKNQFAKSTEESSPNISGKSKR